MSHRRIHVGLCALLLAVPMAFAGQANQLSPDAIWRTSPAAQARAGLAPWIQPEKYQYVELDAVALMNALERAPMEFTNVAIAQPLIMTLAMPDGTFARFSVVESPIMHPDLGAKFPEIRTYLGQGIDDPHATVRFDWTPAGFHAQILSPNGAVYIDPLWRNDTVSYASYFKSDYRKGADGFGCLVPGEQPIPLPQDGGGVATGEVRRTYRLACAATGEYTAFHGGTQAAGLAAVVTAVNRVSGVYETEVAVRLSLVANNNLIIYTSAGSDPYTNSDGFAMLTQNQSNLTSVIGSANYDIGHVFSTGGGGVAGLGVVCNSSQKARGVTGQPSPTGDGFWIDYVAHEMGHQFGSNHCFNGLTGSCAGGNRNASTAYEPGSSSTIMGYAGICGADNLQAHSDPYFHSVSFDEIRVFTQSGGGNSCAQQTATGNLPPTVNAGADYVIPRNTPFAVTAVSGSDPDGDPITYSWEQRDLGVAQALSSPDNGTSPIERVWNPTTSPTRTIPRLSNLLANTLPIGEKYPAVSRTMDWRVVVRDNRAGSGGIGVDNMIVTINSSAGPFAVTSPNTNVSLAGQITVTWTVANTTAAPVSAANVDIYLSTDGGNTFPTLLLSGTPNDGSEVVNLPNSPTTTARIKVQGSGNIFFDISNTNFQIQEICNSIVEPSAEVVAFFKNRYISFDPENGGVQTALRVTLTNLPPPFDSFNGQFRWAGPPQSYPESDADPTPFMGAALQCDPHFRDWSTVGLVHIYGAEIVPSATYDVQAVACDTAVEANYSPVLTVKTAKWGDIVDPFSPPSPTTQPDFGDISAVVDKFRSDPTAPIKARAQLHPNIPIPSASIDFSDISSCVEAFRGGAYPYAGPAACP
jgi:hypothetical protein